jgi:hypothetical protein
MEEIKNCNCPICKTTIEFVSRHPNIICEGCYKRLTDINGERIEFFNTSFTGGCEAEYIGTGKPYLSDKCYVDGIPCIAVEGRFGGIVVEVVK